MGVLLRLAERRNPNKNEFTQADRERDSCEDYSQHAERGQRSRRRVKENTLHELTETQSHLFGGFRKPPEQKFENCRHVFHAV